MQSFKRARPIDDQLGFTLIELLIALGIVGILVTQFTSMMLAQSRQQASITSKGASYDVEQAVRLIAGSSTACKCNFGAKHLATGSNTTLASLQYFMNPNCTGGSPLANLGQPLSTAPSLKVAGIKLTNVFVMGGIAKADLEVDYSTSQQGMALPKPSYVSNLGFAVDSSGNITACGPTSDAPSVCAGGAICWNGKQVLFTNHAGNALDVTVNGFDPSSNTMTVGFSSAQGRIGLMSFQDSGATLTPHVPLGWIPMLCYSHAKAQVPSYGQCYGQTFFGTVPDSNCSVQGIFWSTPPGAAGWAPNNTNALLTQLGYGPWAHKNAHSLFAADGWCGG